MDQLDEIFLIIIISFAMQLAAFRDEPFQFQTVAYAGF